ncbi:MAG: hypothetical protein CBC29_05955 [Methylococcaceae bacterium TMED69]|nr:MAG: hypothetical protein CBC29_05955 [Methylococcaceae bacterium TMED69]|tara:strand:- start:263 stop:511 length:249 start_codon:yes stop_codon:yes gene_type:complete
MKKGTLVSYGWTYKKQKILTDCKKTGLIISDDTKLEWTEIDKIKCRKGKWSLEIIEKYSLVVPVLWDDGKISLYPLENLVEV